VRSLQSLCRAFIDRAGFGNLAPDDPVRSFDEAFHAVFLVQWTIRGRQYRSYGVKPQMWEDVTRADLSSALAQWQARLTPGGPVTAIYVLYLESLPDPQPAVGRAAVIPCETLCIGFPKTGADPQSMKPVPLGGHIDLAGARNVLAAGEVRFDNQGEVIRIDNSSGHYEPWEDEAKGKRPKALLVTAFSEMLAMDISRDYADNWTAKKLAEAEKARLQQAADSAQRVRAQAELASKLKSSKVPTFAAQKSFPQAANSLGQAILRAAGQPPVVNSATVQEMLSRFKQGQTWQEVAVWFAASLGIALTLDSLQ